MSKIASPDMIRVNVNFLPSSPLTQYSPKWASLKVLLFLNLKENVTSNRSVSTLDDACQVYSKVITWAPRVVIHNGSYFVFGTDKCSAKF